MNNKSQTLEKKREFKLTDQEFKKLTGLVRGLTGIVLGDHKKDMVYGRLARRLRELGMQSFSQYCDLLDSKKAEDEMGFLVNAITTNLTKFFRESHHFDNLSEHLTKIAMDRHRRTADPNVLIWSAGCSSGEEPYSIVSTIRSNVASLKGWNVKVLATDLDTNMLNTGRNGIYKDEALKGLPDQYLPVLKEACKQKDGRLYMKDSYKEMIHFKQLNLLHDWPMKRKYDVIFCRNVLIYFDNETKDNLVKRYTQMLRPGGMLFLGHSETLLNKPADIDLIGRTSYVKKGSS